MPLPGLGVVPSSGGLYNELTATTRRAYIPRLFVQMYYATPAFFHMMGNAQKSAGGLSQITVPIQGASMVQGQFTGYAAVELPGVSEAVDAADPAQAQQQLAVLAQALNRAANTLDSVH